MGSKASQMMTQQRTLQHEMSLIKLKRGVNKNLKLIQKERNRQQQQLKIQRAIEKLGLNRNGSFEFLHHLNLSKGDTNQSFDSTDNQSVDSLEQSLILHQSNGDELIKIQNQGFFDRSKQEAKQFKNSKIAQFLKNKPKALKKSPKHEEQEQQTLVLPQIKMKSSRFSVQLEQQPSFIKEFQNMADSTSSINPLEFNESHQSFTNKNQQAPPHHYYHQSYALSSVQQGYSKHVLSCTAENNKLYNLLSQNSRSKEFLPFQTNKKVESLVGARNSMAIVKQQIESLEYDLTESMKLKQKHDSLEKKNELRQIYNTKKANVESKVVQHQPSPYFSTSQSPVRNQAQLNSKFNLHQALSSQNQRQLSLIQKYKQGKANVQGNQAQQRKFESLISQKASINNRRSIDEPYQYLQGIVQAPNQMSKQKLISRQNSKDYRNQIHQSLNTQGRLLQPINLDIISNGDRNSFIPLNQLYTNDKGQKKKESAKPSLKKEKYLNLNQQTFQQTLLTNELHKVIQSDQSQNQTRIIQIPVSLASDNTDLKKSSLLLNPQSNQANAFGQSINQRRGSIFVGGNINILRQRETQSSQNHFD